MRHLCMVPKGTVIIKLNRKNRYNPTTHRWESYVYNVGIPFVVLGKTKEGVRVSEDLNEKLSKNCWLKLYSYMKEDEDFVVLNEEI